MKENKTSTAIEYNRLGSAMISALS